MIWDSDFLTKNRLKNKPLPTIFISTVKNKVEPRSGQLVNILLFLEKMLRFQLLRPAFSRFLVTSPIIRAPEGVDTKKMIMKLRQQSQEQFKPLKI